METQTGTSGKKEGGGPRERSVRLDPCEDGSVPPYLQGDSVCLRSQIPPDALENHTPTPQFPRGRGSQAGLLCLLAPVTAQQNTFLGPLQ